MKFRSSDSRFQVSLHARFALGLGAVLLPFLLAAAVGQFYLLPRLIGPLDDILRELTEETVPVIRLQTALLQATVPVHDYLINGDPDERRQFAQLRDRVERAFDEASAGQLMLKQERVLMGAARSEWARALRLGEELLGLPSPVGNAAAGRDVKLLDAHIGGAVSVLDEAYGRFRHVIDKDRAQTGVARSRAVWVTVAALVVAGVVSLFASAVLVRPLLAALGGLGKATDRLAGGDLSARAVVNREDELGQLTLAFNAMAERLEKNEATLQALAARDGLTGLYNHRTFYTMLDDELARARRFERPLSLLMLDIDHFKRVNDTHGHQAGDVVLKGLSKLLGRLARAVDRVCRYGGEEIAIILPETGLDGAACIADRMRAAVEAEAFEFGHGTSIRVTVSIGVASWPTHADNAQSLVAAADSALYTAKQAGRNRVVRHEPAAGYQRTEG